MMRIFRYTFSLFMLAWLSAGAQTDTLGIGGLRFGFDLSRIAVPFLEEGRVEYDGSVDLRMNKNLYPVIEVGWGDFETEEMNFSYKSTGFSIRAGIDKNYLKKDNVNEMGMFFAGFRYGVSFFKHEAPSLEIPDPYWGDFSDGQIEKYNLHAHWISVVGGMRAEVFRNFFMGWSVFLNIKFYQSDTKGMDPYNIPGFGKGANRATATFNYTISYRIPMQKYTPKIKARKK